MREAIFFIGLLSCSAFLHPILSYVYEIKSFYNFAFTLVITGSILFAYFAVCAKKAILNFDVEGKNYHTGLLLIVVMLIINVGFYFISYTAIMYLIYLLFFVAAVSLLFRQNEFNESYDEVCFIDNKMITNNQISMIEIFDLDIFRQEKIENYTVNMTVDKDKQLVEKKELRIKIFISKDDWNSLKTIKKIDFKVLKNQIKEDLIRPLLRKPETKEITKLLSINNDGQYISVMSRIL